MAEKKKKPVNQIKPGTSKASDENRKCLFVEAYLSNGGNATKAAVAAGYKESGASKQGFRMSKDPIVLSMLDKRRTEMLDTLAAKRIERAVDIELNTERLIKEIARLAFSDMRGVMHEDGRMKLPHELDDATAASIASFEIDIDGKIKYKFWDKNSAQERAAKIIGAFVLDNKQKTDPLADLINGLRGNVLGVSRDADDGGDKDGD